MDRLEACPHHSTHRRLAVTQAAMALKAEHAFTSRWETGDTSELSPDELDTFEMCLDQRQQIVEACMDLILDTVSDPFSSEVRLGLTNIGGSLSHRRDNGNARFTGQADVIAPDGKRGW